MFNPLSAAEVVTAIGRAARRAAKAEDPGGEFERDQLSSAYSATRHLAGEMDGCAAAFARFCDAAAQRLDAGDGAAGAPTAAAAGDAPPSAATGDSGAGQARPLEAAVAALRDERTPAAVGAALADLLAALRGSDDPADVRLRADLHRLLRELADREVAILADALA